MSDAERRAAADQADRKAASALATSQQHQIQALLARVAAIRDLHKAVDRGRGRRCCDGCEIECGSGCHNWPCPTIIALEAP